MMEAAPIITICPHCNGAEGIYTQDNGSYACLDCYWDEDDDTLVADERAQTAPLPTVVTPNDRS